jgi:ABC-type sulfate/molybdate transport systems ATPase subunit
VLEAHIVKSRRDFVIDVSFTIAPGERVGLFGASGEGKSTILSCIAGFETPEAGRIIFDGRTFFPPPMPLERRALGYLTQRDLLFPHLSVAENVRFGLGREELAAAAAWIDELRYRLELDSVWEARARQISGGQARRVALARMLARRPPLVLLDEPFAGLDGPTIHELIAALDEWQRALKFTLITVDHRPDLLRRLCPTAISIERGRIVAQGDWHSLIARPATKSMARLLAND